MEFKASIIINKKNFPKWASEQIREYLTELLSQMERQSEKNGYPLDVGLLADDD